ncbi:MAG: SpoIIIAH-like family protein [Clostridia bacterium]|nr:SpoIIIAH-like family protein [Clostridia bacterium]
MVIKKKQILTVTLALLLGSAVFINWYFSKEERQPVLNGGSSVSTTENSELGDAKYVSATTAKNATESMADFKVKRDAAHDEAKETLNEVIKDSNSSSESVAKATEALKELSTSIKRETDLENLISAKISGECLVIIDSDVCEVIVGKGKLTDNISLQIRDLVMSQTKISSKNITIIELNG